MRALVIGVIALTCNFRVGCDCGGRSVATSPCAESPDSGGGGGLAQTDGGAGGGVAGSGAGGGVAGGTAGGDDAGTDGGVALVTVAPAYAAAPDWNDYVRVSDPYADPFLQPGVACDGTESGARNLCVHGGDKRRVVTAETSCAGLTATDSLGAFTWACRIQAGAAVFFGQLAPAHRLADLLNGPAWRLDDVTVSSGAVTLARSTPSVWWSNPVAPLPANAGTTVTSLNAARTIYVVDTSTSIAGLNLNADKQALVVQRGVTLSSAVTGINCSGVTGEQAAGTVRVMVCSGGQKFLWVEGDLDGVNNVPEGLVLIGTSFAHVGPLRIKNSYDPLVARQLQFSKLFDVTLSANVTGFYLENCTYNTLWHVRGFGDKDTAMGETFQTDTCTNNAFGDLLTGSNGESGFYLFAGSDENTITQMTSVNNGNNGIGFGNDANDDNTFLSVLMAADSDGLWFNQGGPSDRNTFADTVSVDHRAAGGGNGIRMSGASNNKLTGRFVVGNDNIPCSITGGTLPGIDSACVVNGASDAVVDTAGTSATSFVGAVASDSVNTSAAAGRAAFSPAMDHWGFENDMRGWGLGLAAYPSPMNFGACIAGSTCQVWDWTLRSSDSAFRGVHGTFVAGQACPAAAAGSQVFTSRATVSQTFLRAAVEVLGDERGDEDGLCESNETCLFTPNIGAYQGHGTLGTCVFSNGVVTGVTMLGYATNGR